MTAPTPAPAPREFASFEEFWPFYLAQHADRRTRALHIAGTGLAAMALLAMLAVRELWLFFAAFLLAYGLAWIGHAVFERNRPATFTYPLWSLRGDIRMFRYWLAGRLDGELKRAGIAER